MNNIAFIVACEEYLTLPNLAGVNTDIEMMKEVLNNNCSCAMENIIRCTCKQDEQYHPEDQGSIIQMIKQEAGKRAGEEYDIVFFYFSGHGFDKNGHLYLAQEKTDVSLGYSYIVNDISTDFIMTALEKSKLAKTYVCIFDTCQTELYSKGLELKEEDRKGFVVFNSCCHGEKSYLLPKEQGSIFTKCLVAALGKESGCITVQDVNSYIGKAIQDLCNETGKKQRPITSLQNVALANLVITGNKREETLFLEKRFSFGRYPQNSKGKIFDVQWNVVAADCSKNCFVAISDYILDVCQFNSTENSDVVNWDDTTLSAWIKSKMKDTLFKTKEKALIQKFSLLTEEEAKKIFSENRQRKARASNYAIAKGIKTDKRFSDELGEYGQWWLRGSVSKKGYAKRVFCDGVIYPKGKKAYRDDIGVRPIIYLSQSLFSNVDILSLPDISKRYFFDSVDNIKELFSQALSEIVSITNTDYNQIILNTSIDDYTSGLIVFADNVSSHKQAYRLVLKGGLIYKAYISGEIVNNNNIGSDSFEQNQEGYIQAVSETKSELVVPIICGGKVIGTINSESEVIEHYTDSIINAMKDLANELGVVLKDFYDESIKYSEVPYVHLPDLKGKRSE